MTKLEKLKNKILYHTFFLRIGKLVGNGFEKRIYDLEYRLRTFDFKSYVLERKSDNMYIFIEDFQITFFIDKVEQGVLYFDGEVENPEVVKKAFKLMNTKVESGYSLIK